MDSFGKEIFATVLFTCEYNMFLKHLELKTETANEGSSAENIITGPDGETKGHAIFSKYEMLMYQLHNLKVGHY